MTSKNCFLFNGSNHFVKTFLRIMTMHIILVSYPQYQKNSRRIFKVCQINNMERAVGKGRQGYSTGNMVLEDEDSCYTSWTSVSFHYTSPSSANQCIIFKKFSNCIGTDIVILLFYCKANKTNSNIKYNDNFDNTPLALLFE